LDFSRFFIDRPIFAAVLGAPHRVHRARKLNEHAVAGRLDNVSSMFLYLGIAQLTPMLFQSSKCALLVNAH
jgi:hypothetical protein